MSSQPTEFDTSRRMGIYDPLHQMNSWGGVFKGNNSFNTGASTVSLLDSQLDKKEMKNDYASHESFTILRNDQEARKSPEKTQRRLAQNREAARKSRMRKKAYVQQLETSRLKLTKLEQELARAKQQGMYIGTAGALDSSPVGVSGTVNSGIAAFELEYAQWFDEHYRQVVELRTALQTPMGDVELRALVENGLNHYNKLFRMKTDAAKADVFYLTSGMWRTSAERFFLWLGGFRPSELLNVLMPQLQPLSEQQQLSVHVLRQSSRQAEDALSQGIDRLHETLSQSIANNATGEGSYVCQMASAIEQLETLEDFVSQADNLRQQALHHMSRILTSRQAVRGLLALGEYFHCLRALSSLWAARPHESAYSDAAQL